MISRLKCNHLTLGIITFSVVTAHIAFAFIEFGKKVSKTKKKQAIVVRTYTPQKEKTHSHAQTLEKPKAKVKKEPPAKKTEKKPQPIEPLKKKKEAKNETKIAKQLSIPVAIESLHIDENVESEMVTKNDCEREDYLGRMIGHLQRSLELPEEGSVRLEVTVLKSGQIKKMKILASESKTNQHYLEMHLPLVQCPCFIGDWENIYEQTVVFTFCNEKN